MSDTEFRALVREMRAAQRLYFRNLHAKSDYKQEYLVAAKSLEKRVDDELAGNATGTLEMAE